MTDRTYTYTANDNCRKVSGSIIARDSTHAWVLLTDDPYHFTHVRLDPYWEPESTRWLIPAPWIIPAYFVGLASGAAIATLLHIIAIN